jgi:hypothetical protein
MYYKLILEGGHMGAGSSMEMVRYFRAENPVDLYSMAARMPRVKGKTHGTGVKLIEKISRKEYETGRKVTRGSEYLGTRRSSRRKKSSKAFH